MRRRRAKGNFALRAGWQPEDTIPPEFILRRHRAAPIEHVTLACAHAKCSISFELKQIVVAGDSTCSGFALTPSLHAKDANLANGKIAAFRGERNAGKGIAEASVADLQHGPAIQGEAHAAAIVTRE